MLISGMLVVTGILFICSCYSIYKSGSSPFTRDSISAAFSKIAVWTYITLSLVILGAIVKIVIPRQEEKLKGGRTPRTLVEKLSQRVDVCSLEDDLKGKIEKERALRRILGYVRIALITLSAVLPLIYLLNPANFPAESGKYNAEILHGMLVYLAFLAPLFIYETVYVIATDLSFTREYALLKDAISIRGIANAADEIPTCPICRAIGYIKRNEKPIVLGLRIALVGCAAVLIAVGIINGGMADVLNKAIKICTECIGLG